MLHLANYFVNVLLLLNEFVSQNFISIMVGISVACIMIFIKDRSDKALIKEVTEELRKINRGNIPYLYITERQKEIDK